MNSGEERGERSVTIEEILMDFFSSSNLASLNSSEFEEVRQDFEKEKSRRFFEPSPIRRNPGGNLRIIIILTNHSELEEILMDFFSRFRFFEPSPIRRNLDEFLLLLVVVTDHSELEER